MEKIIAAKKSTTVKTPVCKVSDDVLFKELCAEEGMSRTVYYCPAGKLTVGVGHNLEANPAMSIIKKKLKLGENVSMDIIRTLFKNDVSEVITSLDNRLPWFKDLSPARQYVLISMGFNMGVPGLMKFKNTLGCLQRGDIKGCCYGMRSSRWYRQVGNRGPKLIRIMDTDFI